MRRDPDTTAVQVATTDVVAVARVLAVVAVEDGATAPKRKQALARLAQGDAHAARGRFADAVERYGQAWALLA